MDEKALLQKWLNDSLSEREKEAFQNAEDYPFYEQLVADASCFKASHFSRPGDYDALVKRLPEKSVPVKKLRTTPWLLRIASVFVLGFALFYFFQYRSEVQVETLVGQKTTVELPDASLVVLNALSEITYSRRGWDENRSLQLRGEAFFDVAKGSNFDVVTPLGTVSVVGTEFNVKQRGKAFEVICYEGMVRVISGKFTEELRAGDRLRFLDGQMTKGRTTFQGPQWTGNISDFQSTPLSEVIEELERQYEIEVFLENIPGETLFTGGFVHDDLENALRSVTEPLGLTYSLSETNKVILKSREN